MAAAVVAAMVLTLLLPDDFRLAPRWVLPIVEGLLLMTLIAADPGRITRRSAALRVAHSRSSVCCYQRDLVDDPADRRSHPRRGRD